MSNTLNTSGYNWGEQLKVEVGDLAPRNGSSSGSKAPSGPIPAGKHAAFVQEVKHGTFKTGSYGVTFTYVIEGGAASNRKIRENIILKKKDGSNTQYGASQLKRRLMNLGLPVEKLNAFKGPRNEHDLGDFKLVLGAPVTITVVEDKGKDGQLRLNPTTGTAYRAVKAVYSREIAD